MKARKARHAAALAACLAAVPAAAVEKHVEARVEDGVLHGTLLAPGTGNAGAPVVVILPGSGPTDRDGNNPLGVRAAPYRMLAQALAEEGIASLRIDKRGLFASAEGFDPNEVTFDDYAGDAWAWIEAAKAETGAGCAWLLGHSEGGLVALVAAQNADPSLCGVILLAAPGRRLGDVLRDQFRANPANAPLLPDALSAIEALERGERVDVSGFHPALQNLFAPSVQGFLIDGLARDPAALIAGLSVPVLIVQGGSDSQVKREDAERLAAALPGAGLAVLPDMNHVLKPVPPNDAAADRAAYLDPNLPLAPGLAEAIAGFVKRGR